MNNAPSLKTNIKLDSPKTPGGISKSLLTPCRRVGLSRNWRKSGPSPFVSPLAGSSEVKTEKRKRKDLDDEDNKDNDNSQESLPVSKTENIGNTPSRSIIAPRKKRFKTLISPIKEDNQDNIPTTSKSDETVDLLNIIDKTSVHENVTPARSKSKSKAKKNICRSTKDSAVKENQDLNIAENDAVTYSIKQKSPDSLSKECVVVIQKKIYKKDLKGDKVQGINEDKNNHAVSQALFDSDTDDVPLSTLNKNEVTVLEASTQVKGSEVIKIIKNQAVVVNLDDDDDFTVDHRNKVKKLEDKTTSMSELKKSSTKTKTKKNKEVVIPQVEAVVQTESKPSSQSSFDDDDDFVVDRKRTILVRKSYDKTVKPLKAKSTGSITQKDIDNLKARIEMKKKMLLAKAMNNETQELRDLIKKWQKGCQDALMELMDLMRNKFPDKQNMEYSEMLGSLKIPASLVGYDIENDCFNTPSDENIILSRFNDL